MSKFYKGKYRPKNPSKYRGDPTEIIYRSSWELKLLNYLDNNPDIVQYSSEEFFIPYYSPIDNKYHRYFPDCWLKTKSGQQIIVEVKPFKQTQPPTKKNNKKRFIIETTQYVINTAKWDAARAFCSKKNPPWKFIILTEKELDIKI
jgi:hypothetical protein